MADAESKGAPEARGAALAEDAESEEVPLPRGETPAGAAAAPIVIRVAPPAEDDDSEEEPAAPRQARLPRRMAGVCDESTWRRFVPAVFESILSTARPVVGDDEFDLVPFVRATIEGMSFSSESARFSTLGVDLGVPGATPQCIDLLGALARVSAARATQNGEYAAHFATTAALQAHLLESGAQLCAQEFHRVWMVIAAASARTGAWAPLRVKRGRAADDDVDGEALAAMARALDGGAGGEARADDAPPAIRAGRRKRKREGE